MSDEQSQAFTIDEDMPAGFDPDDLDDQMFEGLPAELDPARDLVGDGDE